MLQARSRVRESHVVSDRIGRTQDQQDMDVGYVSALSALAGSVIGGLTSGITTWLNQRSTARAGQLAHELSRRQDLYRDFIIAASKAYAEALVVSEPKIEELISRYAMISRMPSISSSAIVTCAERVLVETTGPISSPIGRSRTAGTYQVRDFGGSIEGFGRGGTRSPIPTHVFSAGAC